MVEERNLCFVRKSGNEYRFTWEREVGLSPNVETTIQVSLIATVEACRLVSSDADPFPIPFVAGGVIPLSIST